MKLWVSSTFMVVKFEFSFSCHHTNLYSAIQQLYIAQSTNLKVQLKHTWLIWIQFYSQFQWRATLRAHLFLGKLKFFSLFWSKFVNNQKKLCWRLRKKLWVNESDKKLKWKEAYYCCWIKFLLRYKCVWKKRDVKGIFEFNSFLWTVFCESFHLLSISHSKFVRAILFMNAKIEK